MVEKFFKLSENGTDVKTEVLAGITTFMTMAYILAVNPSILAAAGMDLCGELLSDSDESLEEEEAVPYEEEGAEESQPEEEPAEE